MHTAPHGRCQSARGAGRWGRIVLAAGWMCLAQAAAAADNPGPTPPPWQRDLDAARILQAAITLAHATDPAADSSRRQRLGQLYDHLLAQYPDQAEVQRAAGSYYEQDARPDLALACWQRAVTLDPHDAASMHAIGSLFLQQGRVREACGEFQHAADTRPDVAVYHTDLANVLYLFRHELLDPPGRPDESAALVEALAHFRRASELTPGDIKLAQAYAETFYLMPEPDWSNALAAWKTVLALSGPDTDFANGHLARVSLHLRRPDDADAFLAQIHDPSFDRLKTKLHQQADAQRAQ